ncbi:MAG: redoxin domain-containing protein [Rickettsiales bacterium]
MRSLLLSITAALSFSAAAYAAPVVGEMAPDFTATDINGNEVTLSSLKEQNVVLEWHNPECPFVKKFYKGGDMQKLQAEMKAKDLTWITINSGAEGKQGSMNNEEAAAYLAEVKSATDHYITDPEGTIGKLYGATATPHMYVIDKEGKLAYMGAIDDTPTADSADIATANNYVRAAVEALSSNMPIQLATSQAYGCSVKYAN